MTFFEKPSTWTTPIPAGHPTRPNSSDYVNYIVAHGSNFQASYDCFGVPVFYADANTPTYTIALSGTGANGAAAINANGWNLNVPIPSEARPAGFGCPNYPDPYDRHIVIIRPDLKQAWDIVYFNGSFPNGPFECYHIKRWDLTKDGIDQPYTGAGCRVSPVPLLQGLITKKEIDAGVIGHAIAFAIYSAKGGSPGVYPCVTSNNGQSADPWAPWLGFRFQLDPLLDLNAFGLSSAGLIIAKAMQTYGLMFVENGSSSGNESDVYAENLNFSGDSWAGKLDNLGINSSLLTHLRLVEPVTSIDPIPVPPIPIPVVNVYIKKDPAFSVVLHHRRKANGIVDVTVDKTMVVKVE